jgi:autotransporter translocation and assembly factor TamB
MNLKSKTSSKLKLKLRLKRLLLSLLALLLVAIVVSYFYLFWWGGIEGVVARQLDRLNLSQYHLDVRIGDIRGGVLADIQLADIEIYYRDSVTSYRLADLRHARIKYSLLNLLTEDFVSSLAVFDTLDLTLRQDSSGQWLLPAFGPSDNADTPEPGTTSADGFAATIHELQLNQVTLTVEHPSDTIQLLDFSLLAGLQIDRGLLSVDLKQMAFVAADERYRLNSARGKLTYDQGIVVVQDMTIASNQTRLKLSGHGDLKAPITFRVDFNADNVDIPDVTGHFTKPIDGVLDLYGDLSYHDGALSGSAHIAGDFSIFTFENTFVQVSLQDRALSFDTLYGTILGRCAVNGRGYLDLASKPETYRLEANIRGFDLQQLVPDAMSSDLNGSIDLRGSALSKSNLELHLTTILYESTFDEYPIHEAEGDLLITTSDLTFADSFRISYFENDFLLNGSLDYSDSIDLRIDCRLNNLDRYRDKLFITEPAGHATAEARLTGLTADPDLSGMIVSDSLWIYGLFSSDFFASVDIARFLNARQGRVSVASHGGTIYDLRYDSLFSEMQTDSHLVYVTSMTAASKHADLFCTAVLDSEREPNRLWVDSVNLRLLDHRLTQQSQIIIDIDSLGFWIREGALGNDLSRLAANGFIGFDQAMDVVLSIDNVPVQPWVTLLTDTLAITGDLSAEALLQGTFLAPEFLLNGRIDSLVYQNVYLGELSSRMQYADRLLRIDTLAILSREGYYQATGMLPVDLVFTGDLIDRFPDESMNISMKAADRRFDLVMTVLPDVEQMDGRLNADFRLFGRPDQPQLEGTARITGDSVNGRWVPAQLKYFDLVDPFYTDSFGVWMENNHIIIENGSIYVRDRKRSNRPVHARIDGELTLRSLSEIDYNLDVSISRGMPFRYELEDIEGRFLGDLHIEGSSPPTVYGELALISMEYRAEFATEGEGTPIMAQLGNESSWDLNITIDILSNYWIKNQDIDAEFAGEVTVQREAGRYRLLGELEILRGKGFLFDKTFRIQPESYVTFQGLPDFNPMLNIRAVTYITGIRSAAGDEEPVTERIEIPVHVTGTLEEPEINPGEGSEFSREDLLPLIVANYSTSEKLETTGRFSQRLSGLISSEMSRIGGRQLSQLGVETFEIDATPEGELDPLKARITLGFYTTPNLYVYGRSGISGETGQEVGFEYRFSKSLVLEGRRDEDELYHINLKAHWEF